jgi:CsoR family transcriptional regulator, copper-sensing transcriptional repressor
MDHNETLSYLRKIEGQIRGVQKMIEENRYCVDILTQLRSIAGALSSVEDRILEKHLNSCVVTAFSSNSKKGKEEKIKELLDLVSKLRK